MLSCAVNGDDGARWDVCSAQIVYPVYIRYTSCEIRGEGGEWAETQGGWLQPACEMGSFLGELDGGRV